MHRRRFRCQSLSARTRSGVTAVVAVFALATLARTVHAAADTSAAPIVGPRAPADLDLAGVVFFPDEGRLEIKGTRLDGLRIGWTAPGPPPTSGDDVCRDPKPASSGSAQQCVFAVPKNLPLASMFRIVPEGRGRDQYDLDCEDGATATAGPDAEAGAHRPRSLAARDRDRRSRGRRRSRGAAAP